MSQLRLVPDLLRTQAQRDPDRPLVRWRDQALTYGEFDARTDAIAAGLADLGVKPGDMVSVMLPNCLDFLEAWWGIAKANGVFGPVNPAFTPPEAAYVIGHSEAVAVITGGDIARLIDGIRPELDGVRHVISIDEDSPGDVRFSALRASGGTAPAPAREPDDLAQVLYTSGTTGKPKGAMVTHRMVVANSGMAAELLPLAPGDRLGMILPLFHANAQIATCTVPMIVGCEIVMWERFSASTFWQTVRDLQPVSISAVPTILAALMNAPGSEEAAHSSLRYIICGAAPLSRELMDGFEEKFDIRILEGYGLTESTCVSSLNPYYLERKAGSIGLPVRGQDMRIRREDGTDAGPNERGEIVLRGPNIMPGYLKNPQATADSIRDGWLYTGDIGEMDDDGYFFIVDRTKDMIIRGGENIYPREIEEVIYEHPGVLECAVIGIPHEVRGEEVLAVVAPKPGVTLDGEEVKEFAAARLARFKVPAQVEVAEELPKTATGKISKGPLREQFGNIWAASK
ncbi:MAG TPA: long-chain fatty acid--CoA ligase [Solirubrobacteraceae bacterium]|jgi:acyl-CoA synthetase (AMP-forming)/AMP-acid ligase II|nr:long-chain fatty acid--CoA ligase [Solirubrobacteraceae bacterium]